MIWRVSAFLLLSAGLACAQPQKPPFPQVPIVLDAQKFQAFYQQLIEIEMKPKAFNQIMNIIQQMEMQAVEEKAKTDAAAKTEKP